jgi:hypothetical protein
VTFYVHSKRCADTVPCATSASEMVLMHDFNVGDGFD